MRFSFLYVLLLAIIVAAAALSKPVEKCDGWVFEQIGDFSAHSTIQTSRVGCRYHNEDGGYGLVCAAPKWAAFLINDKKKLFYPCSTGKTMKAAGRLAMAHVAILQNSGNAKWEPVHTTNSPKMFGHPISVLRLYPHGHPKSEGKGAEYWEFSVATDVPLPATVVNFNHEVHGWPQVNFQPMRCIHVAAGGQKETYTDTKTMKRASFPTDLFRVPADYKQTTNEMEVVMNMDGISDMLDVMTDTRKPRK